MQDDDVNAFTPIEFLEALYRPFFERSLPVVLAVIPFVYGTAFPSNEKFKDFLIGENRDSDNYFSIGCNKPLVEYLLKNLGYEVVQHGCRHDRDEFLGNSRQEHISRIEEGRTLMLEAGFRAPNVFVAPSRKISRVAFEELLNAFQLISSSGYERSHVPYSYWMHYAYKKLMRLEHWKVGDTTLITGVGHYYFSQASSSSEILELLKRTIASRRLSVINSHWWEYFKEGKPNHQLIDTLHRFADYLAENPSIKVIVFSNLLDGTLPFHEISRR